ncbi:hypothetical protein LRY60_01035 [Candidatus Woesebacteria bacterium]|nr:hypothetical protein [Candidatus Woesebacteria bacterium]
MKKAPEWQTPEQQAEFYHHQKYIEEIKTQRREIISDELLPVYSASAEKCGLHINIIGRPGDVYTPQNPSTFNLREHTVQSGKTAHCNYSN